MNNDYLKSERGIKISKHFTAVELDTIRSALEQLAEQHVKNANISIVASGTNAEYEQKQREEARRIRILALDFLV